MEIIGYLRAIGGVFDVSELNGLEKRPVFYLFFFRNKKFIKCSLFALCVFMRAERVLLDSL